MAIRRRNVGGSKDRIPIQTLSFVWDFRVFYDETLLTSAEELNAVAVNLWYRSLTVDFMKLAQQRGFQVNIFTVNEVSEMKRWPAIGIDGIFTDFYRDAVTALN